MENIRDIVKCRFTAPQNEKFTAPQNVEIIDNFYQKLILQYIQWSFSSKLFFLN